MRKIPRFTLRGLTPELFLFIVMPLSILLLTVTFGGVALHQRAMRDMVGQRDQRAVQAAADALYEQLFHRMKAMQGLSLQVSAGGEEQDLGQLLEAYNFLAGDFDRGLAIFRSSGEMMAYTGDHRDWAAFIEAAGNDFRGLFTGEADLTALSAVYFLEEKPALFAYAQNPQAGMIVAGAFTVENVAEHSLSSLTGSLHNGEFFLVDNEERVIYHSSNNLSQTEITTHAGVREALQGQSGFTYTGSSQEHVTAYSPVPSGNWALVIEEPWDSVSSPALRLTEYTPVVLLPVVTLSLLALWFGTQRIVRPLQALQAQAARLGWGDYAAITEPVGGIDEISHLQDELAHLAGKVQAAQQGLRDYIGAMTAGQEDERRRLARELHDDTLQSLIALNQRVQLLRMRLAEISPGSGLDNEAAGLQSLVEGTINNLRRLTRALRPIYLEDLGLATALEMLARELSQPGLSITFKFTGKIRRLSPQVELALYRMAQEALSNIIRHAKATTAELTVAFVDENIQITVADDGQGFQVPGSPAAFAPGGHFGLLGLHERAEMIGAQLQIQSKPGSGTVVKFKFSENGHSLSEKAATPSEKGKE